MTREERITLFVELLWDWFGRNKRKLPWRDLSLKNDTERAYRVLVSEVMLQQTQVSRVIVIYKRFLRQFPGLRDLAVASNKDVIVAWRGMGYNSRALRLRDTARAVIARPNPNPPVHRSFSEGGNPNPIFPTDIHDLLALPGIGPYTAAAIRNFAFNLPTPCIDTNIRRILHRTFIGPEKPDGSWEKNDQELMKIAEEVLQQAVSGKRLAFRSTADWHAALMDFGSLVQTKNNPRWNVCPLTEARIMKATPRNWKTLQTTNYKLKTSSEPGRTIGSRFVPNRIIRGRIIDALRDAEQGLPLDEIGHNVCIDWGKNHVPWLKNLITKLEQEGFVTTEGKRYILRD